MSLAVPEKDGLRLLDTSPGPPRVTVGGSVLTSKLTSLLLPSASPAALFSVAYALKMCFPVGSAALSVLVAHFPSAAVVLAVATSVVPSSTCTVTWVFSLAAPENAGTVTFEGVFGPTMVTTGGRVSTSKGTGALLPSALPMALFSVA